MTIHTMRQVARMTLMGLALLLALDRSANLLT